MVTEPWPVDKESLEAYIRHVNKQGVVLLHLWSRSRVSQDQMTDETRRVQPTYLRLTIPDLLVAYLDIEQKSEDPGGYQVLLVTVFGVREKARYPACFMFPLANCSVEASALCFRFCRLPKDVTGPDRNAPISPRSRDANHSCESISSTRVYIAKLFIGSSLILPRSI